MSQSAFPIKPKVTPIYQNSVFTFDDLTDLEAYFDSPSQRYMYGRYSNPNGNELAEEVNKLEQGAGAVVTSSGMSAIFTAVLLYCQAGDHLLCAEEIYGGSAVLLNQELKRMGITVTFVPADNLNDLAPYRQTNTKLLLAETMSNPLLQVVDIGRLVATCQEQNLKLVMDNTFASPIITRPLALGADVVIHSVTKYLAGHSDVTAGVVVAKREDEANRIKSIMMNFGLNLSPFESWLTVRGLKTLRLRIKQHCSNAQIIAQYLTEQAAVSRVYYPGLPTHPQHELAMRQGHGLAGGMLSFAIPDEEAVVNKFMQSLPTIPFAPSLGGVSTSISHPVRTSHRSLNPGKREALGITLGVIRLSVGVEEPEEIISELAVALEAIS